MGKVSEAFSGIRVFLDEVVVEMKKSSWPTRSELAESTVVIIVVVCILGVFVGISDRLLAMVITWLVG